MYFDLGHVWNATLDTYASVSGDESFVYFGPFSVWASQVAAYLFFGTLFTILDVFHWPAFLYKFKIQAEHKYAPFGGTRNPSLLSTLGTVALAFATELPVLVAFQLATHAWVGTGVRTTRDPPGWLEIPFAIVVLTLLSEVGFYFTHRLLHAVPFLYRNVHKRHHMFHTPVALAAEAQHPFEMALCTGFGMTFWPFLLGTHAQVLIIGTLIGTFSSMFDHCGYWLFSNGSQPFFHDWHHERNDGNFGFLGLMDNLFGTSKAWKAACEAKKEKVRKQAEGKDK